MHPATLPPRSPPASPRPNRLHKTMPGAPLEPLPRPRSLSPHRLMKTLGRWRTRDSLDFGCAGEIDWSSYGPADLADEHYSHTRGHSTSSSGSASTVDSSLPPSPNPPCVPVLPPLPYTSRVPLTPRTAERKRRSDEAAAIDAVNDYFVRVRLSRVDEDEHQQRPQTGGLGITYVHTGVSTFTPLGSSPTLRPTSVELPTPLGVPLYSAPHSVSPVPESEIPRALDELSDYFAPLNPPSPNRAVFPVRRSTSPARYSYSGMRSVTPHTSRSHSRSVSTPHNDQPFRTSHRAQSASDGHIVPPVSCSAQRLAEQRPRRVSYGWI